MIEKKYNNKKSVFVILPVVFSILLFFTSCENFLQGSLLKEQLEKEIEYAQWKECIVTFTTQHGSFNRTGEYKLKQTDKMTVTYSDDDSGYKFVKWTCIPEDAVDFNPSDKSSTEITVKKTVPEIIISPQIYLVPKVSTNRLEDTDRKTPFPQQTDIVITFNKPVKAEDFQDTFKNISIFSDSINLLDEENCYFEKPVLNNNNQTLIIKTNKSKRIIPDDSSDFYKTVSVTLNLSELKDDEDKSFEEDYSFTYRISKEKDSIIPTIEQLILYKNKIADKTYEDSICLKSLENWNDDDFELNHTNGKIYGYVKIYDNGDGPEALSIKENLVLSVYGTSQTSASVEKQLDCKFSECKDLDGNLESGYYEAFFEYETSTEIDGIAELNFMVSDYSENISAAKSAFIIVDKSVETYDWILGNTYSDDWTLPNSDNTTVYWANCYDLYATYNGKEYKTPMEDLNYKFSYGNNLNNLEEITVTEKTFQKHMFENRKDVSWNDYTLEKRKFSEYDSFCQNISYQDSSKETFIKLQVTDSVGNTGYVTYAIPPYNSVLYVQTTGKVTDKGIFTSHVYSEVNPDYTFYLCNISDLHQTSTEGGATWPLNATNPSIQLRVKYEFNSNSDNPSIFYSNWSQPFERTVETLAKPVISLKSAEPGPLNTDRYYFEFYIENYDNTCRYGYSTTNELINDLTIHFDDEAQKYYARIYSNSSFITISAMKNGNRMESDEFDRAILSSEMDKYDLQGPFVELLLNEATSSSGAALFVSQVNDFAGHGHSGVKFYDKNKDFFEYEYFYLPYREEFGSGLILTEAEMEKYKKIKSISKFKPNGDFSNMEFDYKDLEDGKSYMVYVKIYDNAGNCTYSLVGSDFGIKTYNWKPVVEYSEGKLKCSIPENIENTYENIFAYIDVFDEESGWWDWYNGTYFEILNPENGNKSVEIDIPAGKFIRGVMAQEINGGTEYSYPFYFYTGNEKCHAKNIVTGINGITVISDKPCFYYVCASDIGYGKDITAWERKGARSGYGVSTMGNVDTSLVQPGEYYVVIARFADNTYLMTDVMCKTE